MEQQKIIDKEFLERLATEYENNIRWRKRTISGSRGGNSRVTALIQVVTELQAALAEVRAELARLSSAQQVQLIPIQVDDCDHWTQLLHTHVQVIRVLELDEAKLGSEFHYSKRIELDERRKRCDELKQQITGNCP